MASIGAMSALRLRRASQCPGKIMVWLGMTCNEMQCEMKIGCEVHVDHVPRCALPSFIAKVRWPYERCEALMALNLLEQVPVLPRLSTTAIHAQSEAMLTMLTKVTKAMWVMSGVGM